MPDEILRQSVEVGRACIAREHRGRQVLSLLWRGLALYMAHNRLRYLFGCCSLTSQDEREGHRALALPALFEIYLWFKTIDFLVLLGVVALNPRACRMFFG